jgi:hypothetical protein
MEAAASVRAAVSTAVILRNFSNVTRLPRFLFGGEPALGLIVHELRRQTRHKLGNWRSPYTRQRFISRYGESEDRRAPVWRPRKRPLVWRDLPRSYEPYTTCYNRFVRWRRGGVWDRIMNALTAARDAAVQMIDTSGLRSLVTCTGGLRPSGRALREPMGFNPPYSTGTVISISHSQGRRSRAPIGKHQLTRRRGVAQLEEVLNFRVT